MARHRACTDFCMFTDRDFYRSVLAGARESFDIEKLAGLLSVPVSFK